MNKFNENYIGDEYVAEAEDDIADIEDDDYCTPDNINIGLDIN